MWVDRKHIFNQHHAQVPIIDMMEDKWRIYYSTRFNGKSQPMWVDVEVNNPTNILNQSTGPILDLGKTGSFDVAGVMPTELIEVDGVKYMYYIGWTNRQDTPYHNTIGLATSIDGGNNWNKFSDGPIFGTSRLEPGFIGTMAVIKNLNTFYGYYLSCRDWKEFDGKLEPLYDIKIATSPNGIDWIPTDRVAIPLKDDDGGISKASVIKDGDTYYMWYSVRKDHNYRTNPDASYRIKCVSSTDLWNWQDVDGFGLDIDLNSNWDNEMVAYPHIFKYEDELQMLYNGNTFGKTGIGHVRFKK
jgi:hypothetical protein